jgi:nucleosome binding factor SPN SPT16 subunit
LENQRRRREHQKSLFQKHYDDGFTRLKGGAGTDFVWISSYQRTDVAAEENKQRFRRFESYKKDSMLPKEVQNNRVLVDRRAETILLPLFGYMVPFHVSTVKNVTKNDEGEFTYLRFNFVTPNQVAKKDEVVPFDDPLATFIRTLVFRSADSVRYGEVYKQILDLKRDVTKKESQRREMADLVEQDSLVLCTFCRD